MITFKRSSKIIGAKNKEQLEDNLKSSEWEMTPEEVNRLDKLNLLPRAYPYWMLQRLVQDR